MTPQMSSEKIRALFVTSGGQSKPPDLPPGGPEIELKTLAWPNATGSDARGLAGFSRGLLLREALSFNPDCLCVETARAGAGVAAAMPFATALALAEELAAVLGVAFVVLSDDGDPTMMRDAMRAGAVDFIFPPYSPADFRQSLITASTRRASGDGPPLPVAEAQAVREGPPPRTEAFCVTLFGTKGGVGKTTVAVNLATALALGTKSGKGGERIIGGMANATRKPGTESRRVDGSKDAMDAAARRRGTSSGPSSVLANVIAGVFDPLGANRGAGRKGAGGRDGGTPSAVPASRGQGSAAVAPVGRGGAGDVAAREGNENLGPGAGRGAGDATGRVATMAAPFLAEGRPIAVVDLDLEFGAVASFFGLNPLTTIHDLCRIDGPLVPSLVQKGMVTAIQNQLQVLAAPPSPELAAEVDGEARRDRNRNYVDEIIHQLRATCSFLIMDTPSNFRESTLTALDLADMVVVVTTPDIPTLQNTAKGLDILLHRLQYPADKLTLVLNRADAAIGLTEKDISNALGVPINHRVPSDGRTAVWAANTGQPLMLTRKKLPIVESLWEITSEVALKAGAQVVIAEPEGSAADEQPVRTLESTANRRSG